MTVHQGKMCHLQLCCFPCSPVSDEVHVTDAVGGVGPKLFFSTEELFRTFSATTEDI